MYELSDFYLKLYNTFHYHLIYLCITLKSNFEIKKITKRTDNYEISTSIDIHNKKIKHFRLCIFFNK
jgi:hypothetical protein